MAKRYWRATGTGSAKRDSTELAKFNDLEPRDTLFILNEKEAGARAVVGEIVTLNQAELVFRESGVDRLFSPGEVSRVGLDRMTLTEPSGDRTRVEAGKAWDGIVLRWWSGTPTIVELIQNIPVIGSWLKPLSYVSAPAAELLGVVAFFALIVFGSAGAYNAYSEFRYRRELELLKLRQEVEAGLQPHAIPTLPPPSGSLSSPTLSLPQLPTRPQSFFVSLRALTRTKPTTGDASFWISAVVPGGWKRAVLRWTIVPLFGICLLLAGAFILLAILGVGTWLVMYGPPASDLLAQPIETFGLVIALIASALVGAMFCRQGILGVGIWWTRVVPAQRTTTRTSRPQALVKAVESKRFRGLRRRKKQLELLSYRINHTSEETILELEIPADHTVPTFIQVNATVSLRMRGPAGELYYPLACVRLISPENGASRYLTFTTRLA